MQREVIRSVHEMAGYAMQAVLDGNMVTARRWLREIQHDTSDAHVEAVEALASFEKANGDLPRLETIMAHLKGMVIDGNYTKGPVL